MNSRFGKGTPIPNVIDPPESMQVTLCIPRNRDHSAAFFGALYQLTKWNYWQENEAKQGKEVAAVWLNYYLSWYRQMDNPDCEDDMGQCCTPPAVLKRINPETGAMEVSYDNGATWQPDPSSFQAIIVQPQPPVTSGVAATKCDAATNVSEQVNVWINQVSNDFDTASTLTDFALAVIAAIAGAVLVVVTGGGLAPLEVSLLAALGAAFTAAWGAGKAVFDAYWSTEIKDKILCAAYCHIGDNGSFSAAQSAAFWGELNGELPASPAKMLFMGFLSSVGVAGLNAMAASGLSADADCADCPCAPCASKWSIFGAGHGTILSRTDEYVEVQATDPGNGNFYVVMKTGDINSCCHVASVEAVSGSFTLQGWTDCGQPQVEGVPQHTGLGWGTCINYFQAQSATAFTIKVFFDGCE